MTIEGPRSDMVLRSDLYYRDPALFGKQSTVDRYVGQIAAAFSVPRSSLNVVCKVDLCQSRLLTHLDCRRERPHRWRCDIPSTGWFEN